MTPIGGIVRTRIGFPFGGRSWTTTVLVVASIHLAACGGGDRPVDDVGDSAAPAPTPQVAPGATASAAAGAADSTNSQLVVLGDSIFNGQAAGGTCFTCHGAGGTGATLGPDLTDSAWLHGDGSFGFIVNTVINGVPSPEQYPAPMLPMGGAALTPEQVRAVSAYVYSLSRGS